MSTTKPAVFNLNNVPLAAAAAAPAWSPATLRLSCRASRRTLALTTTDLTAAPATRLAQRRPSPHRPHGTPSAARISRCSATATCASLARSSRLKSRTHAPRRTLRCVNGKHGPAGHRSNAGLTTVNTYFLFLLRPFFAHDRRAITRRSTVTLLPPHRRTAPPRLPLPLLTRRYAATEQRLNSWQGREALDMWQFKEAGEF